MQIVVYLFIIFTFLPYISFFNIGTISDVQPYSLLCSTIVIMIYLYKNNVFFKKNTLYFLIYNFFVITFLIYNSIYLNQLDISDTVRGVIPYVSLALISIASFISIQILKNDNVEKVIKIFYWLWVAVGTIQIFDQNALTFWRIRRVITDERGVISLANEPSYFALHLILFTLILVIISDKNDKYKYITLACCVLIAQNAVGVIYSGLLILILSKKRINAKQVFLTFSTIGILFLLIIGYFKFNPNSRLVFLLSSIIFSGETPIYLKDISLNIRFAHLYLSVKAFFLDFFLPHGVNSWKDYYVNEVIKNPNLFIEPLYRLNISNGKIVTMIGSFLYEIGFLSFYYFYFFWNIVKTKKEMKKIGILILIFSTNGLNLSNPLFCFLLGVLYYLYSIREKEVYGLQKKVVSL